MTYFHSSWLFGSIETFHLHKQTTEYSTEFSQSKPMFTLYERFATWGSVRLQCFFCFFFVFFFSISTVFSSNSLFLFFVVVVISFSLEFNGQFRKPPDIPINSIACEVRVWVNRTVNRTVSPLWTKRTYMWVVCSATPPFGWRGVSPSIDHRLHICITFND